MHCCRPSYCKLLPLFLFFRLLYWKTVFWLMEWLGLLADHIFEKVSPAMEALGMECKCLGGGKIEHNSQEKKLRVFGESTVSSPDMERRWIKNNQIIRNALFSLFHFSGLWESRPFCVCREVEGCLQRLRDHLVWRQKIRVHTCTTSQVSSFIYQFQNDNHKITLWLFLYDHRLIQIHHAAFDCLPLILWKLNNWLLKDNSTKLCKCCDVLFIDLIIDSFFKPFIGCLIDFVGMSGQVPSVKSIQEGESKLESRIYPVTMSV